MLTSLRLNNLIEFRPKYSSLYELSPPGDVDEIDVLYVLKKYKTWQLVDWTRRKRKILRKLGVRF